MPILKMALQDQALSEYLFAFANVNKVTPTESNPPAV